MITKLRISNCFCFKGKHELDLADKVYAITASYEDQEGRSNWAGKTSLMKLLGSMPLYGWHGMQVEDDWITEGEDSGWYEIEFDTGARIRRSRTRGKSTQVQFFDGDREVGQKGATAEIAAFVGLNEADFFASCFFKQKEIDKLITLRPSERQELVMGWLDLAPLKQCETISRQYLADLSQTVSECEKVIRDSRIKEDTILTSLGVGDIDELESELAIVSSEIDSMYAEVESAELLASQVATLKMKLDNQADARRERSALGRELEASLLAKASIEARLVSDDEYEEVQKVLSSVSSDIVLKEDELRRVRKLVAGDFSGDCPLLATLKCPKMAVINDSIEAHKREKAKVEQELEELRFLQTGFKLRKQNAIEARTQFKSITSRIGLLEARIAECDFILSEVFDELPSDDPVLKSRRLNQQLGEKLEKKRRLQTAITELSGFEARRLQFENALTENLKLRTIAAESVSIFKLAQTKCAEEGLSEIEAGGNDLLLDAGLDLSVKVRWSKDGKGLAKQCDNCGDTFPASTTVRECRTCKAERGRHTIDKLTIELSDRSGGAEDLGGLALQLSAAAWLRAKRGSNFDVVYLDEVAGSLDSANRKALGTHISKMITGRFGFKQGFVVTHSPDIDEMFPGRIEILVRKDGSRELSVVQ